MDLRKISTFTDFFVICSGTSEPHLKAIAGGIQDQLQEEHGLKPFAVDGHPISQWLVLDYSNVVIHVLHEQKRGYYRLEDLWTGAPRLE